MEKIRIASSSFFLSSEMERNYFIVKVKFHKSSGIYMFGIWFGDNLNRRMGIKGEKKQINGKNLGAQRTDKSQLGYF
jgi:hypothetical protein